MEHALECSGLFHGIEEQDLPRLLGCTGGKTHEFAPHEIIFPAGELPARFAVLLAGSAVCAGVCKLPGELIGQAVPGTVDLLAGESGARALVFRADRVTYTCGVSCAFHHKMADNLRQLLAR